MDDPMAGRRPHRSRARERARCTGHRLPGQSERRSEGQEIAGATREAPLRRESVVRGPVGYRDEKRDGSPAVGHLEALTGLDPQRR